MLKIDPAQRITAGEILLHPWITGERGGLSPNVLELMKAYNYERRLRKCFLVVLATIRLKSCLKKQRTEIKIIAKSKEISLPKALEKFSSLKNTRQISVSASNLKGVDLSIKPVYTILM